MFTITRVSTETMEETCSLVFIKKYFLNLFLDRGEGREKGGGETSMCG